MKMASVDSCASMHPCLQKTDQSVPEVLWRQATALDLAKMQREMALEGVCDRSGAYDNARSVWVESGVQATF